MGRGQWVPDIFRWSEEFAWRRIIGRRQDPYTFHVGMGLWGGSGEDKWKARAKGEKELVRRLLSQIALLLVYRIAGSVPCSSVV